VREKSSDGCGDDGDQNLRGRYPLAAATSSNVLRRAIRVGVAGRAQWAPEILNVGDDGRRQRRREAIAYLHPPQH
jgi:hypothetical protein